jgi:hypothetical protein
MEIRAWALYSFASVGVFTAVVTCAVTLPFIPFLILLSLLISFLLLPHPSFSLPSQPSSSRPRPRAPARARQAPQPAAPTTARAPSPSPSDHGESGLEVSPIVPRLIWSPPHGAWINRFKYPPKQFLDHDWIAKHPERYRRWLEDWPGPRDWVSVSTKPAPR